MEKRIIIASIFSVILIMAWGYFLPKGHHVQSPAKAVKTQPAAATTPSAGTAKKSGPYAKKSAIPLSETGKSQPGQKIIVSGTASGFKNINYSGLNFNAIINSPDGSLSKLKLLKYSYTEKNFKNKVDFSNSKKNISILNFTPSGPYSSIKLTSVTKLHNSIEFIYRLNNNIVLKKRYEFANGKYLVNNDISVQNMTGKPIMFKGYYELSSGLKPGKNKPDYIDFKPTLFVNKKTISPDVKGVLKYKGDISFAGFNSKYFLFSALDPGNNIKVEKTGDIVKFLIPEQVKIGPGKIKKIHLGIFAGPKTLYLLNNAGHNLNSTLSFGFFGFFSILLLHVLEFFFGFVHNYGIAIILLVIAIRIVFYPLTYTGFKSMKQMQKLTPKMNELREKYKDNKAELNKKIMELYKEGKVNPLGGCLPMILQIPVFYGLYMALLISIQMRNAPFAFWLHNLAAQDPYYILPVLMGVTMFISQKMNPTIGDPKQAKLMLFLPVVFTFLFIHFPAGLLLYWTVNNILTIAQQYMINRKFA